MTVKDRLLIATLHTGWVSLLVAAIVGMFFAPEIGRWIFESIGIVPE